MFHASVLQQSNPFAQRTLFPKMESSRFNTYLSGLKDKAVSDKNGVMEELAQQISARSSQWKKYSKQQFNMLRDLRGLLQFWASRR